LPSRNVPGKTTKNSFEVVLFDLGHTLIHFDGTWSEVFPKGAAVLAERLRAAGYRLDPLEFSRRFNEALQVYYTSRETDFIEYTSLYVLRRLLTEFGYAQAPEEHLRSALKGMHSVSHAYWKAENESLPTLDLLQKQGYHLGLISNASDDQDVQDLIDNARLRSYFDIILTSAAVGIRKPHPRIFHMALARWEVPPEKAVMVGDTLGADILGAQNSGMASVWVTRRADRPENTAHEDTIQPDASVESLAELPSLLGNWDQRPDYHNPPNYKTRAE